MSGSNILVILSGSIACYKACAAISDLVQQGHRVRTVATANALRFVGVATLEGLTREPVGTDLFAPGAALDHIALARWADLTLVCPASASLLNRMAAGLADDLATTLLLAQNRRKPLLVAPAMNPLMWQHPATRAAVGRLREWGTRFIAPGEGRTACGEEGEGRLAEPPEIVAAVTAALARPARRMRILVTSGGTTEPIDGVRVITNTSTGATGAGLAVQFARRGHEVLLLRSRAAVSTGGEVAEETYLTFADLDRALGARLEAEHFDAVVHAAAVGDFAVESIELEGVRQPPGAAKLGSERPPVLHLRRNHKILDTLGRRSRNPAVRVVAFKLTQGADAASAAAAVNAILAGGAADFVVHNDLAARGPDGVFPATIWRAHGGEPQPCADRMELARRLESLLAAEANATNASNDAGGERRQAVGVRAAENQH